jgi:hypothetical protein
VNTYQNYFNWESVDDCFVSVLFIEYKRYKVSLSCSLLPGERLSLLSGGDC